MNMRKIVFAMLLAVCIGMLSGCGDAGPSSVQDGATGDVPPADGYHPVFEDGDLDAAWEESGATRIRFDGAEITVDGEGASALEGGVKISQGGVYVLEGTLTDGRLVADVEPGETLKLVLNGVDMSCSTSAPLYISNGDAVIVLAEGTKNAVTDAQAYQYADASVKEPNACVYGDDNLTIVGSGELTVNANFNNGIGSKDELRIAHASITVRAMNNALKGNDCVLIRNAQLRLESEGDGIKSDEDKTDGYGVIDISGSRVEIVADDDGLQAVSRITVSDGEVITAVQGKKVNCGGVISVAEGALQ